MKRRRWGLLPALLLLALLSACGGRPAEGKLPDSGSATVTQLMDAAGQPETVTEAPAAAPVEEPVAAPAEETSDAAAEPSAHGGVDIDLTQMSATMVFAEVSNIMYLPDEYVGRSIRMGGTAASATDPETGVTYHALVIQDATACCASGLEYLLPAGMAYPADGTDAVVSGVFELYEEGGVCYCRLKNAILES